MLRITYYPTGNSPFRRTYATLDIAGPIMFKADRIEFYNDSHLCSIEFTKIYSIDIVDQQEEQS